MSKITFKAVKGWMWTWDMISIFLLFISFRLGIGNFLYNWLWKLLRDEFYISGWNFQRYLFIRKIKVLNIHPFPEHHKASSSNCPLYHLLQMHARTRSIFWLHRIVPNPKVHFLSERLSFGGIQINADIDMILRSARYHYVT